MASFCWQCGNPMTNTFRRPVIGVEREIDAGQLVRMHKICASTYDLEQEHRQVTAQPREMEEKP